MLPQKLLPIRNQKELIIPKYLPTNDRGWLDEIEQLIQIIQNSIGCPRGELEDLFKQMTSDNSTQQMIRDGFIHLLMDRCEFEAQSELPPAEIREKLFTFATESRRSGEQFDRTVIMKRVAEDLQTNSEVLEQAFLADLVAEQRLIAFEACTSEWLMNRYNVALAQSMLGRAYHVTILLQKEIPARYRQLFRAINFHRLIAQVTAISEDQFRIELDGPLSLFRSTQKYGVQLANFLPHLLHCKDFELTAKIYWGPKKVEKVFQLTNRFGLRSHLVDYGDYQPLEVKLALQGLQKLAGDWQVIQEADLVRVGDKIWVPDFTLMHQPSGYIVWVEIRGYWRKGNIQKDLQRLAAVYPHQHVMAVSDSMRADDNEDLLPDSVYVYKRQPLAAEIIACAEKNRLASFSA
jgi:uncharacterized protein